ncbi:MAG TPA: class I adenylate-forming enzyme family protein [Allosphingosinicella sp.]
MATAANRIAPTELTLDGVAAYWASRRPDDMALRCTAAGAEEQLDWRGFDAEVAAAAGMLRSDIAAGKPVAIVCATGIAFHVLVNALWRLGAGVLLIDRNWGPAIVEDLIALVGCRTIFAQAGWSAAGRYAAAIRPYPARACADGATFAPLPPSVDPDAVALYAATSGTTDNPKCVAITHRRIRSAYRACLSVHDFAAVERCACLFELNSLGILGVCFLLPREVGAGTTIYPSFTIANAARAWRAATEDGTDFVYLVPPLVRLLNALPPRPGGRPILAFCSAAPVAEPELRSLEAAYPVTVYNSYGLTELTFAVFFGCRATDGGASESIGYPVDIRARLIDAEERDLSGPGAGELLIAGPMLTDGYLHNPAGTEASWSEGWLKTGDIAERDADGRYYIRGRLKDVVLRGGYTYYLGEFEHYLRRAPNVVDACAFRGRDLPSGDELCVVVQVSEPVEEGVLLDWVRDNLGPTKLPNALYVWQRGLPRNSNGKIQRNLLMQMHREGRLREEARG